MPIKVRVYFRGTKSRFNCASVSTFTELWREEEQECVHVSIKGSKVMLDKLLSMIDYFV